MKPKRSPQAGFSMLTAILILGIITIVIVFFRREITKTFFPRDPNLQVEWHVEREAHLWGKDTYHLSISMYQEASKALTGALQFLVVPSDSCRCNFHRPTSEIMKEIEVTERKGVYWHVVNWQPGRVNEKTIVYDLEGADLNSSGLSDEEAQKRFAIVFGGVFYPSSDSVYREAHQTRMIGTGR